MEDSSVMHGEITLPDVQLNVEDVKRYIAANATDKELYMFMNIARSYGLNPFKREIHFVKYGSNPGMVIVGYESYIKRAERTGLLDGWDVVLGKDELGEKATITIYRKDRSKPFCWTVYKDEFDQQQANWKKMPKFMLRKVAIAQGFRLAFPEDIGGMPYIPEEMPSSQGRTSEDLPTSVIEPKQPAKVVDITDKPKLMTKAQERVLWDLGRKLSVPDEDITNFLRWASPRTQEDAEGLIGDFGSRWAEWIKHVDSVSDIPL